jgi:hypothetical protein
MTETTLERKPLMRRIPNGKFKMHDFQRDDIAFMSELKASANWSEMGAMKTSTAEWLWSMKTRHIPNPRILVITTKSGKGTYYESLPEVLPDWDVYTVSTTRWSMVVGGKVVPVDVNLPDPLHMRPVVVIAHYHCFTNRACVPQQINEMMTIAGREVKRPVMDPETGLIKMKIPRLNALMQMHWDGIIVDEAHRIKNHDAQWTRNIKKLKAEFKHVMTGTGFVNNPAEIWSLLNFLYPKEYSSYWKFREYFCEEDYQGGYRKIVGIYARREPEFKELVKRVGVRRTMLECFPNIKEPIETTVQVELNPVQQKMYNQIKEDLWTMDQAGTPLHSPNVLSMLNRLRQIGVATPEVMGEQFNPATERKELIVKLREPSSKLDATMEIIEGMEWDRERRDQVVVFSNFRDPLSLLENRLKKAGISYLRLLPEMNEKVRYELWKDKWTPKPGEQPKYQVFLSTLAVGSESINLSAAHRAIFLDQAWSPAMNKQAIGRIYRPGQTGVAQMIYIRAENTVDYRVLQANMTKHSWFKQVFGIKENGD